MKCIIGLGNPGKEYEQTRHNTGFIVLDEVCRHLNVTLTEKKFKALYGKVKINQEDVLFIKPQTFMNASGEAVISLINYFKINLEDILVISDDLDLVVGKVRFRKNGNDGGQRGLRSIIQHLSTRDFARCKVGIGRDSRIEVINWVMGKIDKDPNSPYQKAIQHAAQGCIHWISHGIASTMNQFNGEFQ